MLSQISDLTFFYFLCNFHKTLDKLAENCHKPENLVDQVDCNACIQFDDENRFAYLRLRMLKFFFASTSCFYIAGTL